jgi:hypothetical protein
MRPIRLALTALALTSAATAWAGPSVTLNGVPIDGVTGQKFENATVVIDEKGDIHIQARGYAVRTGAEQAPPARPPVAVPPAGAAVPEPPPPVPGVPAVMTRRYFLAVEHSSPGTGFDLAIFVNSQWIREVKAGEVQAVMELTKYLRPGPNKVVLSVTRRGERPTTSKDVTLRVVVGEGNIGGDQVVIDTTLLDVVHTAAEAANSTEEYVLQAR